VLRLSSVNPTSVIFRVVLVVLVPGLATAVLGCGTKAPAVTGVTVAVAFSGVEVQQLEIGCSTPAGVALEPKLRPEQAGAPLGSPQSVSVYLPDALAGEMVTCTVAAHAGGLVTGTGSGKATLILHQLVRLSVELIAGAGDGAAPDDGPTDGPEADASADGTPDAPAPPTDGPKTNGQPCAAGGECESTLCVDGVCCASACAADCESCNQAGRPGTCAPDPAGTKSKLCATQPTSSCGFDGMCDGNGGCRRYPMGVLCKAEVCQGSVYVPSAACDGQGTCVMPPNVDCTPYVCDSTGTAPACRTTCRVGGADCKAPAVCAADSCGTKPKQPDGAGCVDNADCTSTHCVDGVCCASACTASCTSCNQTGKEGMCLPVPAGKADPRKVCTDQGATMCQKNGLCDGKGACQLYPDTTVCGAASCNSRFVRPAKHCDGKGACASVADVDCQPYRCDPMATACFKSCTDNSQCAAAPKKTCNTAMMICQ
jgi:hypothetical protein